MGAKVAGVVVVLVGLGLAIAGWARYPPSTGERGDRLIALVADELTDQGLAEHRFDLETWDAGSRQLEDGLIPWLATEVGADPAAFRAAVRDEVPAIASAAGGAALAAVDQVLLPRVASASGLDPDRLAAASYARFPDLGLAIREHDAITRRFEARVAIREAAVDDLARLKSVPLRAVGWSVSAAGAVVLAAGVVGLVSRRGGGDG